MKFLTRTEQSGWVVEMSAEEVSEFRKLILAVEGKEISNNLYFLVDKDPFYTEEHREISTALAAIRSFYDAKFRINQIEKGYLILRDAVFPEKSQS